MNYALRVVSGNNIQSEPYQYLKDKIVAVVFSVVITMNSGKITLIEWDNDCGLCDSYCLTWNSKAICAESECSQGSEGDCDPRVYISWIGTDKNGNNLLSSGYRMSQFRKYSINKLYSEAKTSF
jgi:hypothetical protein